MTYWVGSISFEQRGNWETCKQKSLFGSNTVTALGVRAGDELFIWGSKQGWLARCRATADARKPVGVEEVPWPEPERYTALIPMEIVDEPATPLFMSGSEIAQTVGIGTIQLPRFPRVDVHRAERLTVLLSETYQWPAQGRGETRAQELSRAEVTEEPLIRALAELKVDRQLGKPAPYQQLVLLWAIAKAVQGRERLQPFSEVRDELRALLAPFAVGESQPEPELPWFALRKSPWWQFSGVPDGPVPRGGRDFVRNEDPAAGLGRAVHDRVRDDQGIRDRAVERLTAPLAGHRALQSTLASLFVAEPSGPMAPVGPQEHQEAIGVLSELVGQRLVTTTGAVNEILAVEPPDVVVATSRSPEGQRVPLADVQRALDLLHRHGEVLVDVPTLGHRSSFIGAVLATLDNATVGGSPPVVSLLNAGRGAGSSAPDVLPPAGQSEQLTPGAYVPGQIYDRGALHEAASQAGLSPGNRMSGITVVGGDLCVFWNPFKVLYANRWLDEPREFTYSGEGSVGDQTETLGNLRLIEHEADGRPVMVFLKARRDGSSWRHLGPYQVIDHSWGDSRDTEGNWRRDLRFCFAALVEPPPAVFDQLSPVPTATPPAAATETELWEALERRHETGKRRRATRTQGSKRVSDPLKTHYVVQRALDFGGSCELCGNHPGWVGDDGMPHYQAHHIHPDIDLVDWIAALCGTCHDRMHHATDRVSLVDDLLAKVQARQVKLGRPINSQEQLTT